MIDCARLAVGSSCATSFRKGAGKSRVGLTPNAPPDWPLKAFGLVTGDKGD